jgi:2-methylisocitrate lyase-like PEP mutase family enzyme
MTRSDRAVLAKRFRELNLAGRLLLPNVWDASSARVFEQAGFTAVGTTSAGIAYTRGLRDAEHISREDMVHEIATIAAAVACPVTADIEAGYGSTPADVAETVEAVIDAGAVGVNLEDNTHGSGSDRLFSIAEQAARLNAAREAANSRGIALVINARTDTFLARAGGDMDERIALTIERGRAYLTAGADLVFVPVLTDPAVIRRVVDGIGGPVSLMALPGAPSAAALFEAGASRVSIGQLAMLATLGLLREIANELRTSGTWKSIERSFYGFKEAEELFR